MRAVKFIICTLPFLAVHVGAMPPQDTLDNPAYADPAKKWETIDDAGAVGSAPAELKSDEESLLEQLRSEGCRDTINKARVQLGQPPLLDREPATPDKPHYIYAVDRREGGCSVMVMKGSPGDIRPLPAPMEGPLKIPAEANGK